MKDRNLKLRRLREAKPSGVFADRCMGRAEVADFVCRWVWTNRNEVCPFDRKYMDKLENGRVRWPREPYRAALRSLFGVATDAELGFVSGNAARATRPLTAVNEVDLSGLPWTSRGTVDGALQLIEGIHVEPTRRDFAGISAATLFGAAFTGRNVAADPAKAQLTEGVRVGAPDIEALNDERLALAQLDDRIGSGLVIGLARCHLARVAGLLKHGAYASSIAQQLHQAAGEAARLLAWLLWDQADYPAARHHFIEAFHAARTAGDPHLCVHAASFAAAMESEAGNPHEAVRLAGIGINAPCYSAGLRGLAYYIYAECAGAAGDIEAARRSLDAAQAACSRSGPSTLPRSLYWWNEAHELEHKGRVNALLGNHDLAHMQLNQCIQQTDASTAGREQLRATMKRAEALMVDPSPGACDEAALGGFAAIELLDRGGIQSPRNGAAVRRLAASLAPYNTTAVREFCERARDVA